MKCRVLRVVLFVLCVLGILVLGAGFVFGQDRVAQPTQHAVLGPESFPTFAAWMQHLQTVDSKEVVTPAAKPIIPNSFTYFNSPYYAQKYLRGDSWASWAIKHNQQGQAVAAAQQTEQLVTGTVTRVETNRGTTTITTTPPITRPVYRGGPVLIFNPYCPPLDQ